MTAGSPALCRVSIQLDAIDMDVALPADIPLGALLPALHEIAVRQGAIDRTQAAVSSRHLSMPGMPPLDLSLSLSELLIRDGATLVLSEEAAPAPAMRPHHDSAELLAEAESGWTSEFSRVAGLLIAVALIAAATFLVVPGTSAVPRLLLCASATSMVCGVATLLTECAGRTLTVIALAGGLICVATLPATLFVVPLAHTGVGLAVVSIIVLSLAGRVSVQLSGLRPRPPDLQITIGPDTDHKIRTARRWLSCLTCAGAACSALGVVTAVGGAPPSWPMGGLTAAVTAVLLMRAKTLREPVARTCLLVAGITCGAALLLEIRHLTSVAPVWICLIALGGSISALRLGQRGIRERHTIRGAATAELLAQAAVIPLAAWVFGWYTNARGFSLW